MPIKHTFQSTQTASSDPEVVGSEQWNAEHQITGPQHAGAVMLFSDSWQVSDELSTVEVNGVSITKSSDGIFSVFVPGLGGGGVLVQTAPGFTCEIAPPYYDTLYISFKNASDDTLADPTFFSLIAFRN